jgi:hypothetical protein
MALAYFKSRRKPRETELLSGASGNWVNPGSIAVREGEHEQ